MLPEDVNACGGLVERGDPDRFRAAMAAPVAARQVLFPLYAFNVEVARAPWVTAEPMIAQMRLQWWRDALDEIATGIPVRRHEVVTPLAVLLDGDRARLLDDLVSARSHDIHGDRFADADALWRYLDRTSGHLMWVAAQALGAREQEPVREVARAAGLANWLCAVPDLRARGRQPLPQDSAAAIKALAQDGLDRLAGARRHAHEIPRPARSALLPGWQAEAILRRARDEPERVDSGTLRPSPARAQVTLMWQAATGRF